MRGLVLGLLTLLTLVSLTNVFALSSASVGQNRQVIAITKTESSLLSITPGTYIKNGNTAGTVAYSADHGTLVVDFTKGGGFPARENGSITADKIYFRDLIEVTNQSGAPQCVSVYVSAGTGPSDLAEIQIRPHGSTPGVIGSAGKKVAGAIGARTGCIFVARATTYDVDFLWSITTIGAYTNTGFSVTVEARPASW